MLSAGGKVQQSTLLPSSLTVYIAMLPLEKTTASVELVTGFHATSTMNVPGGVEAAI